MDFRILGPLEVSANGERLELGGPKQRALLAMLLLNAGEVVSSDRLVEALWADKPPAAARHAVEVNVSRLRKTLGVNGADCALVTRAPGYVLHVEPGELDVQRFERLLAEGRRARATETPSSLPGRFTRRRAYGAGGRLQTSSSNRSRGWTSSGCRSSGWSRSRSASRLTWRSVVMASWSSS